MQKVYRSKHNLDGECELIELDEPLYFTLLTEQDRPSCRLSCLLLPETPLT